MLPFSLLLALACCVHRNIIFAFGSSASSSAFVVDTGYAQYLGNHSYPNTVAYLGIPYAEPPVGDRRFRAPLPLNTDRIMAEAKGAVIDATKYPDFCVQGTTGNGDAGGAGSEDCLKVNIYAPVNATKGSNLPVLVYIHGGGYIYGNPANWPFDHWVNQSPNIVVVSIYYRLSSFGFLATPAMRDPENGDLNAGVLDQVQALKWVQAHIASFGGDPRKVTINGQSAGASSVELQIVAHASEGLFSQAIAQSVLRVPLPTPEQQEALFSFYATHAGCALGTAGQQIACLRNASVSALAMAQDAGSSAAFTASEYNVFHPVIDDILFSQSPTKSILAGRFAKVPLIVGATSNETKSAGSDIVEALQLFFPSLTTASANALAARYPLSELGDLQFQTATGDSELRCARSILGERLGAATISWTYRYNQRTPGAAAVFHASENWMMFRGTSTGTNGTTTFQPMGLADIAFAQELIAYWVSFVRAGNPNTFKLARSPAWAPFTSDRARIVLQEDPNGSTTISGSFVEEESEEEASRCNFVAGLNTQQEN